jgi:DNA ligase-1
MSYFLDPELIFEVTCQDLTRSPLYSYAFRENYGGISLRFPVFQRIRDDKPVEDCSADVIL